MSFNRPDYLTAVLESLKAQRRGSLEEREIHLFQDGAVNLFSGFRYASDEDVQASVDVFLSYFPSGTVHHANANIGICENFYRAERYVFETREFGCAYFLEDDLVLSPVYLLMLDRLLRFANSMSNVAYFAAYGNYYAPQEEVAERRRELITLDHHWAFGLLRRHWLAMQPQLQAYYKLVRGTDYSRRFDREIFALYEGFDASPRASSQDAAKAFACDRLGLWRCNTMVPFAKYIGVQGQHMTPEAFAEIGFDRAIIATEPVEDLDFPNFPEVTDRLGEQHALFREIRGSEWAQIVSALPATKLYDPGRKCTREDVIFGYRLFLDREPDSEAQIEGLVGYHTVFDFVLGLINSPERQALALAPQRPQRMCSPDDVTYAYRLCLNRDPEAQKILDDHVGKTDAVTLAHAIWNGNSRRKLWETITPIWSTSSAWAI
jgi:hypothetical protein